MLVLRSKQMAVFHFFDRKAVASPNLDGPAAWCWLETETKRRDSERGSFGIRDRDEENYKDTNEFL